MDLGQLTEALTKVFDEEQARVVFWICLARLPKKLFQWSLSN